MPATFYETGTTLDQGRLRDRMNVRNPSEENVNWRQTIKTSQKIREMDFCRASFLQHCQISVQFIWIPSLVARADFDKEPWIRPSPAPATCHALQPGWSVCTIPLHNLELIICTSQPLRGRRLGRWGQIWLFNRLVYCTARDKWHRRSEIYILASDAKL